MAYLDLSGSGLAGPAASPARRSQDAASAQEPARFSALEWTVVALAEHDTIRSLSSPGRLSRALGSLFGRGVNPHLADSRLEALRRFGVAARATGGNVVDAVAKPLLDAGFARPQLAMVAACAVMVGGKLSRLA